MMTLEQYITTINELRRHISAPILTESQILHHWLGWGNSRRKHEIKKLEKLKATIDQLKKAA